MEKRTDVMAQETVTLRTVTDYESQFVPTHCPECGSPLYWSGVNLVCNNPDCSNSIEQDLMIWLQNLVPLDNLGDTLKIKFLNQLQETGHISDFTIESVMECKLHLDETTPSTQFNNFAKMWNDLHNPEVKFDLVKALMACNVPRIGDLTAIKLAKHSSEIQKILDNDVDRMFFFNLANKFGTANTESVQKHIHKLQRLNLIRDRIKWETQPKAEFKGKVAITGALSVKRSVFEEELRRNGYEPTDTVNKDTKFLITQNPDGQSSKNLKASQLGIPKMNEFDFRLKHLK